MSELPEVIHEYGEDDREPEVPHLAVQAQLATAAGGSVPPALSDDEKQGPA